MYRSDKNFIALAKKTKDFDTNADFSHLDKLPTLVYGLPVTKSIMIARNAGKILGKKTIWDGDLSEYTLEIAAFKMAVMDLKQLHARGWRIGDIKLANMTYDEKKKRVNFIDVNDIVNTHNNERMFFAVSRYHITPKLEELINTANSEELQNRLDAHKKTWVIDEYLLAKIIISITAIDEKVKKEVVKYTLAGSKLDSSLIASWAKEYILDEYKEMFCMLIDDPIEYANTYYASENRPALADMLKFS